MECFVYFVCQYKADTGMSPEKVPKVDQGLGESDRRGGGRELALFGLGKRTLRSGGRGLLDFIYVYKIPALINI